MAKSASRYVYEVSVDYTGDLGLKRLQEDLNRLGKIDAFRRALKRKANGVQDCAGAFSSSRMISRRSASSSVK